MELVFEGSRCSGVRSKNGLVHAAETTICALGAYNAALIPSLGRFNMALCWPVAHILLTETECDMLRGLPVILVQDLGFFFEPDPATRLLKLCPLGSAGYSNTNSATGISLPPDDNAPSCENYIPLKGELQLRTLLRETIPWLADRPFVDKKLYWFSDSRDLEYCIDFVPDTAQSLVALSGDSGHGFKMMPIFGKWVVDLLEKGRQDLARWQWKAEQVQTTHSNSPLARVIDAEELSKIIEEKNRTTQARM